MDPPLKSDFRTTNWSLIVLAVGEGRTAESAMRELCEVYWPPLYAFARRSGCDPFTAQDLTQDFVAHMLERGLLENAAPERGRFRTYLLRCMKNMMTSEWRRAQKQKRGGGKRVFSLDDRAPEDGYRGLASAALAPDQLYDRHWAETLVDRSIKRLRDEWEAQGKPFDVLKAFLVDGRGESSFAQTAEALGTTESALRTSVHRLRKRYGEVFRDEVAQTVADAAEVEGEIRYLLAALSD
jgi:RNA polymerase sigma factor (sigma-70 family)